ncbi:hypothetical protein ACCO45_006447 [Purpureocillium lilacinum]|uniref:Uncharacterized protein n=1 Tax=Purpureocillium lilacinum TaxID=33203 RepID=A0ACC4DPH4_PURLI
MSASAAATFPEGKGRIRPVTSGPDVILVDRMGDCTQCAAIGYAPRGSSAVHKGVAAFRFAVQAITRERGTHIWAGAGTPVLAPPKTTSGRRHRARHGRRLDPSLPRLPFASSAGDAACSALAATDTTESMAALDDLFTADAKLRALADDSGQLQDARRRFETTPPVYRSRPSAEVTQLHSPEPATEEERRIRDEKARLFYIKNHRTASWPDHLFGLQKANEIKSLLDKWRREFGPHCYGSHDDIEVAERLVRERWREWGIWSEEWQDRPEGRWRTDVIVPIEPDPTFEAEIEQEIGDECNLQGRSSPAEQEPVRTAQHCDDDNSRPYNLFLLSVGVERQRLRDRSAIKSDPHDINTQAYNAVRKDWEREGIWRTTWGTLPGMTWKHEHPLKEIIDEEASLTLEELDHTKYYTTTERLAALPDDTDDTDPGTPYSVRSMSPFWRSGHFHPGKRPLPDADALFPIRGESHQSAEPETPDADGVPMQVSQQSCEMTGANNPFKGLFGKPVTSSGPVENSNGTDPDSAPCPPSIETANGKSSPTDKPSTARKSPKRKRGQSLALIRRRPMRSHCRPRARDARGGASALPRRRRLRARIRSLLAGGSGKFDDRLSPAENYNVELVRGGNGILAAVQRL